MPKRGLAALAAAMMLLSSAASAESAAYLRDYGGSGLDVYGDIAAIDGGLLVAGSTTSTDGDLRERTRSGKAGWLFRLDEKGNMVWNFCSSRWGMDTIIRPTVHDDGRVTCVLAGEGGAEWLEMDDHGRAVKRVSVPDVETHCLHERAEGETGRILMPYDDGGEVCLALITLHGDDTCCIAKLGQDGALSRGLSFFIAQNDRIFAPCRGGSGRIAMAYIDIEDEETGAGTGGICYVKPGTDEAPEVVPIDTGGMKCTALTDCEPMRDGSLLVGLQHAYYGCYIARVNELGETMFAVRMDNHVDQICETTTGFAAKYSGGAAYFDEDGVLLGTKEVQPRGEFDFVPARNMAAFGDGTAILYTASGTGKGKDRIRVIAGDATEKNEAEYGDALFWRDDCTVADAWGGETGVVLLLDGRDGERVGVYVDGAGNAREIETPPEPREAGRQRVSGGTLTWREEEGGASVALEDETGRELWRTRTPIHTAADRLEWRCAAELPDGSFAFGGRYTYDVPMGTRQEGVMAVIGRDSVLQKLTLVRAYGDRYAGQICDMLAHPTRGLLMLVSTGQWTDSGVSRIVSADGSVSVPVSVGIESEGAHLLADGRGRVYVVGTDEDNGLSRVVLVGADLDTNGITD